MLSVTVEKPGFVQENPGAPADNTEPCVPPSYFFLGSCWPCRTPGAFWPEGESRRGRGMKFIDEEGKGIPRMSISTMKLSTWCLGFFTGGTWRDRTPRTGE